MTGPCQSASGLLILCSVITLVWMFLFNIRPIQDPDIWWHLASGRYMIAHGSIPKTDVFSLTAQGTPWVNTYWLQDILSDWVVQKGGITALTIANALAIAVIVFLIGCSNPAGNLSWATRLWGIIWIFLAGQPRGYGWEEKASLVTFGFLGLLFHTLRANDWTRQIRWLAVWPSLFLCWANLHRGFILGLIVLSAYVAERWITEPQDRQRLAMWWATC